MSCTTITLSWDTPPLAGGRHAGGQPLDPDWARQAAADNWRASYNWYPHIPAKGAMALTFFHKAMGISDDARLPLLCYLAHTAHASPDGAIALLPKMFEAQGADDLAHRLYPNARLVHPIKGAGTCVLASPHAAHAPDATFSLREGAVHGTGLLAGTWDAATFFAPAPPTDPLLFEQPHTKGSFEDILAVGAVAAAFGALCTWMRARAPSGQPLHSTRHPFAGLHTPLAHIVAQALHAHGIDGMGEEENGVRRMRLQARTSDLARHFQARTRAATASGRTALAHALVGALLDAAGRNRLYTPAPLPMPTGWLPSKLDSVERELSRIGTHGPFKAGGRLAEAITPDAPEAMLFAQGRIAGLWP